MDPLLQFSLLLSIVIVASKRPVLLFFFPVSQMLGLKTSKNREAEVLVPPRTNGRRAEMALLPINRLGLLEAENGKPLSLPSVLGGAAESAMWSGLNSDHVQSVAAMLPDKEANPSLSRVAEGRGHSHAPASVH